MVNVLNTVTVNILLTVYWRRMNGQNQNVVDPLRVSMGNVNGLVIQLYRLSQLIVIQRKKNGTNSNKI